MASALTRKASSAVSADEFREAIAALGMNQREAALALEVDDRTVRKWALGERAVPGPVRAALRGMRRLRACRCGDGKQ